MTMQRPTVEEVRADLRRIANVAQPGDSLHQLGKRLVAAGIELSRWQLERRLAAMERDLGLAPADPGSRGGGRLRSDGAERAYSRPGQRRAGAVARNWARHHGEDCL